mgnify:CR=1 FL=1
MAPVHHRMPLVLRAQEVRPWLEDEQTARRLLHETPPELERRETDGQLRLWLKKRPPQESLPGLRLYAGNGAPAPPFNLEPEPFV